MAYPVCSEDGEVEAVLEFVRKKGNNFSDYDTEVGVVIYKHTSISTIVYNQPFDCTTFVWKFHVHVHGIELCLIFPYVLFRI